MEKLLMSGSTGSCDHSILLEDYNRGEVFCGRCGLVVRERIFSKKAKKRGY